MKAFLLAAGEGTRLRPITNSIPKCLVPIRGTPLLAIWFDICRRFGIDEILINVHTCRDKIRAFVATASQSLHITIAEEPVLLGSAGTLLHNRQWVANDSEFWIFYADVLNCVQLNRMVQFHRTHKLAATLGLYHVDEPERCGIAQMEGDGVIRDFVEKPKVPVGNLAFCGIAIGTPEMLEAIPCKSLSDIAYDVLPRLKGKMAGYRVSEYIRDIGTMHNYLAAQQDWPGIPTLKDCSR